MFILFLQRKEPCLCGKATFCATGNPRLFQSPETLPGGQTPKEKSPPPHNTPHIVKPLRAAEINASEKPPQKGAQLALSNARAATRSPPHSRLCVHPPTSTANKVNHPQKHRSLESSFGVLSSLSLHCNPPFKLFTTITAKQQQVACGG